MGERKRTRGEMDGYPSTIAFISHLPSSEEDASQLSKNKLRVIFLSDADSGEGDNNDFPHAIKGNFTSACGSLRTVFIPPSDKCLIDEGAPCSSRPEANMKGQCHALLPIFW